MKPICMHGFHIINNLKLFVLELETSKSKAAIFMMQIGSWFSFDVMEVESVLKKVSLVCCQTEGMDSDRVPET